MKASAGNSYFEEVFTINKDKKQCSGPNINIKRRVCAAAILPVSAVASVTAFAAPASNLSPPVGPMSFIWIAALIILVIIEAVTYQLVTIWFAVGALGALICSLCGLSSPVQLAVFLVLSAAMLLILRPLSKKYLKNKTEKTNVDSLVGMDVLITEKVSNIDGSGKGKLCGMEWTVRSEDGAEIAPDETAVVKKIEGVKLIVSRKENK